MPAKEILKKLVETDDKMERMKIVEENEGLFDESSGESNSEEVETLQAKLDEALAEAEAQKQRYIDRFFSGVEATETKEEKEEVKEEAKSLDEILNNKGGNK